MKVILSRKGFDSANGGIANPIMPDGTMISMPIPSSDDDCFKDLYYGQDSYLRILRDLKNSFAFEHCHVDPDINIHNGKSDTINEWKPAFGQINQAATYLKNTAKVDVGDVFLFFGTFHRVCIKNDRYQYVRRTGDPYSDMDLHVIYGYMQVGEILNSKSEIEKYYWHPHSSKQRLSNPSNTLYIPSERLSFDQSKTGSGLFAFDRKRVLTEIGCPKATWKYNDVYAPNAIIGSRKNSAKDNGIYYSGIWQELALCESEKTTEWMKSLF